MKKKIKVLQVIPKLDYGGAETGCYDLAHFLPEQGCKSFIVTSGGVLLKFIKKEKVKVFRLPVQSKNPILILFNAIIISLIILIYNINIVHARSRAPAWSCLIATKITSRKFVTTFHGTYNFSNRFKKFYNSVMVRSHLIIAGSNFIFSHINENYGDFFLNRKRKLLVIFRGINANYFNPQKISLSKIEKFSKKNSIDRDKFIILLPGRLSFWKGQKIFIEALKLLSEQINNQPFEGIIIGGDQGKSVYKKQLIALVERYRLKKIIKFIDHCDEMPVAYKISNLVCSCSSEPEAFGRVSVEAQSMGIPIIASDIGASTETIVKDKTGFLFKSGDSNALTNAIIMVMQKDYNSLKSIGFEGRKNILKKFDVDKMCHTTFTEYKKLIELS
uniref:Glycosyl transferase, group 1 family protein n=1 Tax=uncultured marine bacterium 314 TaxID=257387 RepID=Q6SHM5_9BACT|nr:glycosyl transferase, group 1 family protein [uncultured marine bacterium 314]